MPAVRRAVIDVGTNSVKLLVADVVGQNVTPVCEQSKQTRLGNGFYETHRLQPEPLLKTAVAVARFAAVARELHAESIRVFATSAARDALNAHELVSAIREASRLDVDILSGEQEAELAFQGVTTDPELASEPLLLLDVGGGSTEFILGHGRHKDFQASFPLGTVRLLEKVPHTDPPLPGELNQCREWVNTFLAEEVRPKLQPALQLERTFSSGHRNVRLVGTGGTTSILARMEAGLDEFDRERIEKTSLSLDRVRWHLNRLWSLPLAERQLIPGLPPKRADVILTGVIIYEAVMTQLGFDRLCISTRGLRFAAIMTPPQLNQM